MLETSASRAPIWHDAIKKFATDEKNLYEGLKSAIETLIAQRVDGISTLVSSNNIEKSNAWEPTWVTKVRNGLPSLSTVQGLIMPISQHDPHKIAPAVCAAVFFTIRVSFFGL